MTICGNFLELELKKEQAELMSWKDLFEEQLGWKMSKEKKEGMMDKMMGTITETFFSDMTAEDKQKMMDGMMSMMMGVDQEMEMPMMPHMMIEMMLRCLGMMLHKLPKEKRIDFVVKMVVSLIEQGCVGMSEEEKKELVAKIVDKVKIYNEIETA